MSEISPNNRDQKRSEVYDLADALLSGAISAEQSRRLADLVGGDDESLRHYIRFMYDSATLGQWGSEDEMVAGESPVGAVERGGGPAVGSVSAAAVSGDSSGLAPPAFALRSYSLNSVGGTVLSYVIVTLLLAVGVIAARLWEPAVGPQQLARKAGVRAAPSVGEPAIVATITAAVDCRWAEPATATSDGAAVPLGRRYALESGILEIRYASGTDVILEGPAVYEVDSDRGGLLSRGKLTARVERPGKANEDLAAFGELAGDGMVQGSGFRVQGSGGTVGPSSAILRPSSLIPRSQSPIPNSPFTVRTAAATVVAGLRDEFGLEVDSSRISYVHAFLGGVTVKPSGGGNDAVGAIPVPANAVAPEPNDWWNAGSQAASWRGRAGRIPHRVFLVAGPHPDRAGRIGHGLVAQRDRRGDGWAAGCRRRRGCPPLARPRERGRS